MTLPQESGHRTPNIHRLEPSAYELDSMIVKCNPRHGKHVVSHAFHQQVHPGCFLVSVRSSEI